MNSVLAADLGGTKCRFALVAEDERLLGTTQTPTPRGREALLAAIEGALRTLAAKPFDGVEPPCAIGIGTAGVVRPDRRTIDYAPNLDLEAFDLGGRLESSFGLPTVVLNDGRASAVGEYLRGDARGRDPMLVLFFGTGIGIGLIAGGQPYGGVGNAAGEIGHTVHVPGGLVCACGRHGCYEAYCGGRPMGERARRELGPPPQGDRWDIVAIQHAAARDARARGILDDARTAAGAMVASACTLLNPAAVVLGGGVIKVWPELFDAIDASVRAWCAPIVLRDLEIVRSRLGSDAIVLGAAAATGRLW